MYDLEDNFLTKFNILIRGENVRVRIDGRSRKAGFYIRRYVKAKNKEEAEHLIVQVLMKELKFYHGLSNDRYDPPRLFVDSIEELTTFEGVKLPGSNFKFYF